MGALGAAILAAALVLSRSRAAWLALAICAILLLLPTCIAIRHTNGVRVDATAHTAHYSPLPIGVIAALFIPNQLNWKSDSPYLDSVRGVVDYSSGSGRGRVIQYKNTFRMAAAHPLLGVGPGNWPVYYPHYSTRHDPSLTDNGTPANPWPSSDWMAILAERGVLATLLFVLTLLGLLVTAWRARDEAVGETVTEETAIAQRLAPLALAGTVVITTCVSAFDAVMLLAAPTLIAWSALGALSVSGQPRLTLTPSDWRRRQWIGVLICIGGLNVARSATQIAAMASSCAWPVALTLDRCRTAVHHRSWWPFARPHRYRFRT